MYETTYPIRDDIRQAHAAALAHWASPGTWWTGEEKLAIVEETRRAIDADAFPPWVAPSAMEGVIPEGHRLPTVAIDAIWRLAVHPGSLTQEWYRGVLTEGLDPERYVELVSIVATVNGVDRFARALSLPLLELPAPSAGEPTRERPDAEVRRHWVPTVQMRGPNVLKALSLVPAEVGLRDAISAAQYVPPGALLGDLTCGRGRLDRLQIELVAARTSMVNECFY